MFKKLICMLAVLLCTVAFAAAETAEPEATPVPDASVIRQVDLTSYTIDELLTLREEIERELLAKGHNPFFDIERGDRSEQVSRIQERLTALGFYTGRITGQYDSATMRAFKLFEKANGLDNDGLASREDQAVLFSIDVKEQATPTPAPKNTSAPKSSDQVPNAEDYGTLDYTDSMRYPGNWQGKKVKVYGQVLQVVSGSRYSGYKLLVYAGNDLLYVSVPNDPGYNILENDKMYIYATVYGTYTYTTIQDVSKTVPYLIADYTILR